MAAITVTVSFSIADDCHMVPSFKTNDNDQKGSLNDLLTLDHDR